MTVGRVKVAAAYHVLHPTAHYDLRHPAKQVVALARDLQHRGVDLSHAHLLSIRSTDGDLCAAQTRSGPSRWTDPIRHAVLECEGAILDLDFPAAVALRPDQYFPCMFAHHTTGAMQTSLAHIAIRRIAIAELLRVQDNEIDRAVRDSANPWIGLPDLLREPPEARSPEITRLVPTPTHFPGVYRIVTTSTHDRAYTQDAILMSAYQTIFAAQLAQLRALSGDGYALSFVESGFFAALLQGGILMCSDIVTSHSADEIFESDLESAARQLLGRCHPTQLIRMQFYHTHPGAPMGRTISRGDVDYALRLRATVAAYGARVAVDMHALPFEWAFLGESAYYDPNRREFVAQRFDPILLRATIPVAP